MGVKLSVIIITFNEEGNIGRCLESVKRIADEVVVVDSYSTDRTKEICESFGATVVEHPFEGYIEQKRYALTLAQYTHVLSLDADEVVSEELCRNILAAKENWYADVYDLNRLTNYCGSWVRHSGWYPDWKTRLFDKTKMEWGGENPHDRVFALAGAKHVKLSGDLLHYSYNSIRQHLNQVNFFTDVAVEHMIKKGKRASILSMLVNPPFKFIKMYFLQLGFLDGFAGFCIAVISAYGVFIKYAKLYLHHKNTAV